MSVVCQLRSTRAPRGLAMKLLPVVGLLVLSLTGPAGDAGKVRHRLLVADDSTRRIAILDADGKTEWEHKIGPIHDLHLLPNGHVLCQLSWTRVVEIDPKTDKVVWEYDAAQSPG